MKPQAFQIELNLATSIERLSIGIEGYIREMVVVKKMTHENISDSIQQQYPGVRGLSSRSVRRFCHEHGIHSTSRLPQSDLIRVISSAVAQVTIK